MQVAIRRVVLVMSCCLMAALTGCGAKTADVSGRVTFRRQPTPWEPLALTFVGPNGQTYTAQVSEDGSYHVRDVDVGETKVAVTCIPAAYTAANKSYMDSKGTTVKTPPRKPSRRAPPPGPPQLSSYPNPVPQKYWSTTKSPLALITVAGANTFDISIEN